MRTVIARLHSCRLSAALSRFCRLGSKVFGAALQFGGGVLADDIRAPSGLVAGVLLSGLDPVAQLPVATSCRCVSLVRDGIQKRNSAKYTRRLD